MSICLRPQLDTDQLPKLRIDVYSSGDAFPDVHPYILGTPHDPPSPVTLQYPIILTPRQKLNFFIEKQSFNAFGMLQNPMILLMGVMGVLVLGLPYLIVSILMFSFLLGLSRLKSYLEKYGP